MTAHQHIEAAPVGAMPERWRKSLMLLGAIELVIIALFFGDAADMGSIWWNSSTYGHCLIVAPIIAWLLWQRRDLLVQLTPRASLWGLAVIAVAASIWTAGEATHISLFRHAGLVLMLQGSVIAILGLSVTRGLLFPLFYAVFLIPFGDEIVPALQLITADLSMFLLGLIGLPAHIEGIYITTPSGYFRVAEACSGVKFLIAMIALGALAANLCFHSWRRRIAFMAICIIVPIIANGIRAFGTIYIADKAGIEFAASFDHIVYGWIFFAIVITIILAIGWRFFDRDIDELAFDPEAIAGTPNGPRVAALPVAAMTIGLAALASFTGSLVSGAVQAPIDRIPSLTD
ncbi:MAG: exosortase A [Sphingomonadaceae bacterium]|nr:exosortase A [Sphingomonadaceae bacterium]